MDERKPVHEGGTNPASAGRKAPDRPDPIAEGLRRLWAEAEAEPVPDDFLDILDRIDAARSAGTASGGGGA